MEHGGDFASVYDLARNYYRIGDYEQSRSHFESALTLSGARGIQEASLYWEYSLCLYKMGECAQALAIIKQGLTHYPDCRELYHICGQIYYELGLLHISQSNLIRFTALKAEPSSYPSEQSVADYKASCLLSAIAARRGNMQEATYYLQLFLMENPPISYLERLCLVLLHLGMETQTLIPILSASFGPSNQFIEALFLTIQEYEACLHANRYPFKNGEGHSEDHAQLGRQAFERGCFTEARDLLQKAVSRGQGSAQDYCIMGIACSRLSIYNLALEHFLQALALDPENRFYSCFAIETLAIQAIKTLVQRTSSFEESPLLINELLRLCSIRRKSRNLRQQMVNQSNDLEPSAVIYGRCNILSPAEALGEE